jgi:hypothetical protein
VGALEEDFGGCAGLVPRYCMERRTLPAHDPPPATGSGSAGTQHVWPRRVFRYACRFESPPTSGPRA